MAWETIAAALGGGLVGGFVTGIYNRWNQSTQWDREQGVRHSDQRLATYVELVNVAKDISSHPNPDYAGDQDRLVNVLLTIDMIATAPVRKASENFLEMTDSIKEMKRQGVSELTDQRKLEIMRVHDQFIEAVRVERGIRDRRGKPKRKGLLP